MALTHAQWVPIEPTSPKKPLHSLRRFRKSVTAKFERLCSSPSSLTTRSSSLSSQPYDEEPLLSVDTLRNQSVNVSLKRLRRIEAVRIEHSIRKHDHRYYVVYVYLKSPRTPIYRRDPDYEIEVPYVEFFALRDTVLESSRMHTTHCRSCETRVRILRDHHNHPRDLSRLVRSTRAKEQRLEKLIHCLLGIAVDDEEELGELDSICDGCIATSHALAAFLKRQYQSSTGII